MLSRKLLEILACPACHGPLTPRTAPEALDCPACRLRYRVEDDIPILLAEEAEELPPDQDGER